MPFSSLVNGSSTGNEGTCALPAPRNLRPVPHSLSNHAPSPVPRGRLPRASGQPAAWLCPLGNCHWNLANTRLRRCAFMPFGCSSSMPVAMCAFARDGKGAGPQSAVVAVQGGVLVGRRRGLSAVARAAFGTQTGREIEDELDGRHEWLGVESGSISGLSSIHR